MHDLNVERRENPTPDWWRWGPLTTTYTKISRKPHNHSKRLIPNERALCNDEASRLADEM